MFWVMQFQLKKIECKKCDRHAISEGSNKTNALSEFAIRKFKILAPMIVFPT